MPRLTYAAMVREAARYLERNRRCGKHHVEHTGSNAYLLDFYDYLHDIEKGKEMVWYLLDLITASPEGAKVFYPGHLNPMNMSQNVIDTGTATDAIARFASRNRTAFSDAEHARIGAALSEVADGYLVEAVRSKKITNQRLWGLTGLASYARYVGKEGMYRRSAHESIEQAFRDMTVDGFFRYYPNPARHLAPYDNVSAFYQSRHTAFIYYALEVLGMDVEPYRSRLEASTAALLSLYTAQGYKDMRMDCKRWYWRSPYEVASNSFDAYALVQSIREEAHAALHNALYQIRSHFYGGFLHSHKGTDHNFQCPIFWTAHLAWLTRIPDIERRLDAAETTVPFSFRFAGREVFSDTNVKRRILVHTLLKERNPTAGLMENGIEDMHMFWGRFPHMPHAYLFSAREAANHTWYALRGFRFGEGLARACGFFADSLMMLLPAYRLRFGVVETFSTTGAELVVTVRPASRYGTPMKSGSATVRIPL